MVADGARVATTEVAQIVDVDQRLTGSTRARKITGGWYSLFFVAGASGARRSSIQPDWAGG